MEETINLTRREPCKQGRRICRFHVHLRSQTLLFGPNQGGAKFRLLLDFARISDFEGGQSWGFDLDKFSTI